MVREQVTDPEATSPASPRSSTCRTSCNNGRCATWKDHSAFVPVVVAEHLSWDDVDASRPMPRSCWALCCRGRPGLSHYPHGGDNGPCGGLRRPGLNATCRSSRNPTRCCRSRASRSVRPASSSGSRTSCGRTGAPHEVSAAGQVMRELGRVEGTAGEDITLPRSTSRSRPSLRCSAWRKRGGRRLTARTATIVALASRRASTRTSSSASAPPTGTRSSATNTGPLANKVIAGTYPPDRPSPVVALAALAAG